MTGTEKSLKKILISLDKKLKNIYYSDFTLDTIQDAINLGQLDKDMKTINILEEEIMNIILGRTALNKFQDNLKSRLNLPKAKLLIVNKVINDKIFEPVKNELDQLSINKPRLNFQGFSKAQPVNQQAMPEIKEEPKITPIEIEKDDIIKLKTKQLSEVESKIGPGIQDKVITELEMSNEKHKLVKPEIIQSKIEQPLKPEPNAQLRPIQIPKPITTQPSIKTQTPKSIEFKQPIKVNQSDIKEKLISQAKIAETKPNVPEYSFPEPIEVQVIKPTNKIEELKKVITPSPTSSKQDKIRNKLLEAMSKKEKQPQIVQEIKNVLKSNVNKKKEEKQQEEQPKKRIVTEAEPSIILTGQTEEFKSKTPIQKSPEKRPYVLDVKLQEIKKEQQEKELSSQPIKYQKYKKKNPFGEIS